MNKNRIPEAKLVSLNLILTSKLEDRENFRRLVLSPQPNGGKSIMFYMEMGAKPDDNILIYDNRGKRREVEVKEALRLVKDLVKEGYCYLICESYTETMDIRLEKGQVKVQYRSGIKEKFVPPLGVEEQSNLIRIGEADELLRAIDIMDAEGSIKPGMRRKYEQVNRFIELVQAILDRSAQKERVVFLDCGCGKSYLSFVMNYYLREKLGKKCYFYGIDNNPDLVENSQRVQMQLGYANMEFQVSCIADFQTEDEIDIVCSLHACDTATDEAIGKGFQLRAPYLLIVPCCQSEVLNQLNDNPLKAMTRHGVYKTRLADLLTDGLRTLALEAAGYKVSVVEYVSPIYTPKNIMFIAERIQSRNSMAKEQYREIADMFDISPSIEKYLYEVLE